MELATNTFTKGLQCDTNPMITGNDVMTDCLNGTIVTMNGNEVILLNDMGNRRVDNAFLPPGYLPVGMKEYGGIIYVAAYNPITNKSLIGSFPSPERKMGEEYKDLNALGGTFDFTKFIEDNREADDYLGGILVLKSDSFLVPLTNNLALHAGDKFSIYSSDLYKDKDKDSITNFDNVNKKTKKVLSPKNKKYTLSIGILNSQNEFVDITKSLCRWNENGEIISYDGSESDIYKFNDGYFIANKFNNESFSETSNDSLLIKERQKMSANTYSYKLVGPMYLKVQLNHIEGFDYNIYGKKEVLESGKYNVTLWVEGYLTYNCPDNLQEEGKRTQSNDDYETFEEGIPTFNGFDFYYETNDGYQQPSTELTENVVIKKETRNASVYDVNTNLYKVKIVKEYFFKNWDESIPLNYIIGVNTPTQVKIKEDPNSDDSPLIDVNCYLKNLSVKNSLDISLLGSGNIEISEWKFYNNESEKYTILKFSLNAYPLYGETFSNLKLKFTDLSDSTKFGTLITTGVYNGRLTFTLNWDTPGEEQSSEELASNDEKLKFLEANKVYRVDITYNSTSQDGTIDLDVTEPLPSTYKILYEIGQDGEEINTKDEIEEPSLVKVSSRWLLTTPLFNEYYNNIFINDYCNVKKDYEQFEETEKLQEPYASQADFYSKMDIELVTEFDIDDIIQSSEKTSGSLYSKTNNIDFTVTNTATIKYENLRNSRFSLPIESNFKNIVEIVTNGDFQINKINSEIKNKKDITLTCSGLKSFLNLFTVDDLIKDPNLDYNSKVSIIYYDKFKGTTNSSVNYGYNVFRKLDDILDHVIPKTDGWCGVFANSDSINGGLDGHMIDCIFNNKSFITDEKLPGDTDLTDDSIRLDITHLDEAWELAEGRRDRSGFRVSKYLERIFDCFNLGTNNNLMFTYLVILFNTYYPFYLKNRVLVGGTFETLPYGSHNYPKRQYFEFKDSVGYTQKTATGWNRLSYEPLCLCRVWWKTPTGWAWFRDVEYNKRDTENFVESRAPWLFPDKLKQLVYCVYNEHSLELPLYSTKNESEYKCNNFYKFTLNTEVELSLIRNISIQKYEIGNLLFKIRIPKKKSKSFSYELNSSLKFQDLVNSFDPSRVENVTYDGILTDKNGDSLNQNLVYERTGDGLLQKFEQSNFYFYVDREHKSRYGENLLLFKSPENSVPTYRFNLTGGGEDDGDDKTYLDFDNIPCVPKGLFFFPIPDLLVLGTTDPRNSLNI